MNTRVHRFVCVLALSACASIGLGDIIEDRETLNNILGDHAINEDFESYVIDPGETERLLIPVLRSTTIANGQGPGLVEPGASYVTGDSGPNDRFIWQGAGYFDLPSKTIVATEGRDITTTLTIEYDEPVVAMGMDLFDYQGFSHATTVSVFDPDQSLIESFGIAVSGPTGVFFGYEADAIGSVVITGNPLGWSTVIDDHTYGIPCNPCDMNCDGIVNAFDLEPFLDLLFGPNPDPCSICTGDANGDGNIDEFDIEPFLECLFP